MSRKPGIATNWFKQWNTDVFPNDYVVMKGKPTKVPKFYDTMYQNHEPEKYEVIKNKRVKAMLKQKHDNTPIDSQAKRS